MAGSDTQREKGMKLAAAIIIIGTAAHASDERRWPAHVPSQYSDSYVRIHAPTVAHAAATVTFVNEYTHHQDDAFTVEWNGIAVTVQMDFAFDAAGAERITVDPPQGYAAVPPSITINDGDSGEIQIVEYLGG